MNRAFSVYLDFVRFTAALLVFFFHANDPKFHATFLDPVGQFGRDAVMAFFVLSGFVISYVAHARQDTFGNYLTSRVSRLYSVVVPALVLTLIVDRIGLAVDPSVYADGDYQSSQPVIRFVLTLLLVQEVWFWSWHPFSNGPFWSISYELFYYLIFGAFFYFQGRQRWLWGSAALLLAGPKILLLLPVWLLGLLLHRFGDRIRIGNMMAAFLFVMPIVVYLLLREDIAYRTAMLTYNTLSVEVIGSLGYSIRFLSDYVIGLLFTMHLAGALVLMRSPDLVVPKLLEKPIRYLAGMTFSLYLYHFPLLMLGSALFDNGAAIVVLVLVGVASLAPFTEGRKQDWRRILESASAYLRSRRWSGSY